MSCPLLNLPNEILTSIIAYIEDQDTLRILARTSTRLQSLTESLIYQSIFHRTGEAAVNLAKAIEARPARADAIQIIDSRCKWQRRAGLLRLPDVIHRARNLRELTVESPYCKHAYGTEADVWAVTVSSLARSICGGSSPRDGTGAGPSGAQLKRLTLHLSGRKRFWDVDHLAPILAHSTLESLTISCAELHKSSFQYMTRTFWTPLQRLILIECNLTLAALAIVLSQPRALKELHLGENCNHTWFNSPEVHGTRRYTNRLCSTDPKSFFECLNQQSHSLEELTYAVKGASLKDLVFPEDCGGLSNLKKLKHITLDGYCPYFQKALTLRQSAPPNLTSLTAKGDMFRLRCTSGLSLAEDYQSHVSWIIEAASISDHLQSARLVSSRTFTNVSQNHREALVLLGQEFTNREVSMQVFKRTFAGNVPPFLFGEQEAIEDLVYDTESGFCEELKVSTSGDRAMNDIDF